LKYQVFIQDSILCAGKYRFDLNRVRNVYVLGGGKAAGAMTVALEEILGARIVKGVVNVPEGNTQKTRFVKIQEASHPLPSEAGVEGTRRMMAIADEAGKDDIIIMLISGGGSSLMPLPRSFVTLEDKQNITDALSKSGARINEINAVRKHISDFKGGWLAKKAYPATILNLILSDVVGNNLEAIASGSTVPDSTTFLDARKVLEKYYLWQGAPISVRKLLSAGEKGIVAEPPKSNDPAFRKVQSVALGNCRSAAAAACRHLRRAGLNTLLLTTTLEGEARYVGEMFGALANSISNLGEPIPKPAAIVAAGETTVTVAGKGLGGRNQELALGAALKLNKKEGMVVASLSTDGIDGRAEAAVAIADTKTSRAEELGLEARKFLEQNDSYHLFKELEDLIIAGPIGTNVNDISVIIVL
jgi:glycerate-2-kinase